MIKKILFLLLGTVTFVTAKAETTDYKLDVHDFSELVVVDGINVDYFCKPDSAGIAVFSCEPEMASHIMFSQKNDRNDVIPLSNYNTCPWLGNLNHL